MSPERLVPKSALFDTSRDLIESQDLPWVTGLKTEEFSVMQILIQVSCYMTNDIANALVTQWNAGEHRQAVETARTEKNGMSCFESVHIWFELVINYSRWMQQRNLLCFITFKMLIQLVLTCWRKYILNHRLIRLKVELHVIVPLSLSFHAFNIFSFISGSESGPRERSPSLKNLVVGEPQLGAAVQVSPDRSAMPRPRHR